MKHIKATSKVHPKMAAESSLKDKLPFDQLIPGKEEEEPAE